MFKKSLAILVAIFGLLSVSVAQAADAESFLFQNYGWTFDTSKWNLKCAPTQVLPAAEVKKNGKDIGRDTACFQKEKTFWFGIVWRVPAFTSVGAEEDMYWAISKPLPWFVVWNQDGYPSVVDSSGFLKDAFVKMQDVETPKGKKTIVNPVSFYHFMVPMPNGRSFIDHNGNKETNLAFTIELQGDLDAKDSGSGHDDLWVKKMIREIADSIRMTETK